jgi:hypothetical protein
MPSGKVTLCVYGALRKYFEKNRYELEIGMGSASLAEVLTQVRELSVNGFNKIWSSERNQFNSDIVCLYRDKKITNPYARLENGETVKILQNAPGG